MIRSFMTQHKKMLLITGIIVVVLTIAIIAYRIFVFQVTSVDPSSGILPFSQRTISITTNHRIGDNIDEAVSVSNDIKYVVDRKDNQLYITLDTDVITSENLEISINDLESADGQRLSKKIVFDLEFAPNRLSPEEQRRQIQESDSFETSYDLVQDLPKIEEDYEITYEFPSSGQIKMPIIITALYVDYEKPFAPQDDPSNLQLIRASRDKALEWLSNQSSYDTRKYQLYFSEDILLDEYNGQYYRDLEDN